VFTHKTHSLSNCVNCREIFYIHTKYQESDTTNFGTVYVHQQYYTMSSSKHTNLHALIATWRKLWQQLTEHRQRTDHQHAHTYTTSSNYILDWIEQGLTSPPTQYRLSGRQFYRSKDPTNSIKVLKENYRYYLNYGQQWSSIIRGVNPYLPMDHGDKCAIYNFFGGGFIKILILSFNV